MVHRFSGNPEISSSPRQFTDPCPSCPGDILQPIRGAGEEKEEWNQEVRDKETKTRKVRPGAELLARLDKENSQAHVNSQPFGYRGHPTSLTEL